MKTSALRAWTIAGITVAAGMIAVWGCKSSDDDRRLSRKGEACQTTNDCESGLSCVPLPATTSGGVSVNLGGGICVTGEFNVATTAKECAVIECSEAADCCPTPSTQCPFYQAECADAGPGSSGCTSYDRFCKCDTARLTCTNGRCGSICNLDAECGTGNKCVGGKCVQCLDDSTCQAGWTCQNGSCTPPCTSDGDCPMFQRCQVGKCVDGGCQTDRECIAATKNVEATCGTDGKCIVPCQTDLECGNPKAYSFYSCINRQCTYVGCASDKDCELYLTGGSSLFYDAGALTGKTHVVCRDMATTTTAPAK